MIRLARTHNAAVERRRDALSSAPHVHNAVAHVRRARADVSPSAPTACYAAGTTSLLEDMLAPELWSQRIEDDGSGPVRILAEVPLRPLT